MNHGPFRIVLVEDSDGVAYLFHMALERAELTFKLTVLPDGAEAISFFQREGQYAESPSPDRAVMDLNLPKTMALKF